MDHIKKPLVVTCDELNQIKGGISQVQATLNATLNKAPTEEQFKLLLALIQNPQDLKGESKSTLDRVQQLISAPQTKVAVRLRQLYDNGQLPLISALLKLDFKSSNVDRYLDDFLKYNPRIAPDSGDISSKSSRSSTSASSSKDLYSYPPPLPPINNQTLLIRITTDKSYRQPSDFLESATTHDFNKSHNAKLAIGGRSIMELVLFEILDELFPNMYEDDLFVIRSKLMSPGILTKLAFGYRLVDHTKYSLSTSVDFDEKLELISKLFLSYIAGLNIEGYTIYEIKIWIRKLYEPMIQDILNDYNPYSNLALVELNLLFKSVGNLYKIPQEKSIIYEIIQVESDPFVAQVLVNGEALGVGTSTISFEEAKRRAASDILNDHERVARIINILFESYHQMSDKEKEKSLGSGSPASVSANLTSPSEQYSSDELTNSVPPSAPLTTKSPINEYPQQKQQQQGPSPLKQMLHSIKIPTNKEAHDINAPQPYGMVPPATFGSSVNSQTQAPTASSIHQIITTAAGGSKPPVLGAEIKYGIDSNARNKLYALLGVHHLMPIYEFHYADSGFQAIVKINDEILGVGYDINKKIAGQKAAMCALTNTQALVALGVDPNSN
ncbi:hypothetical protein JA1_001661 [Spathaspora sp. JA1]|nr:hypothetical protein JA1_001661 [Spathaspora sp. JA1]